MMTVIVHEDDADLSVLDDTAVAVVGYGNQGRPWALNLRDSGLDVHVCVRADSTREQAVTDGFAPAAIDAASAADVICLLVPDDAIPTLPLRPAPDALVVLASGYTLAFGRLDLACDVGLVAPRMLGPEVRRCYEQGVGFISGVGVHRDETGRCRDRTLAVAKAVGGLRQGAIELTPRQEAVLDLAVEQALAPALRQVTQAFLTVMLEQSVPLEAILCELFLSGEVERTYRRLRIEGYAAQMAYHSPVSQYGQLSRASAFEHVDVATTMREIVEGIASGRFADEWQAESEAGFPTLARLKYDAVGPEIQAWERELRTHLGEGAIRRSPPAGRGSVADPH
jgi:ketol-acid reductoisomerase